MDRHNLLNFIRGAGTLLVVIGHAIIGEFRVGVLGSVWSVIYSFHMFLFFWISGYLFECHIEQYCRHKSQFIKKKFVQLIVPYLTLTIVSYGILVISRIIDPVWKMLGSPVFSAKDFLLALFLNQNHFDTHLWFIYRLFWIFVINILFHKFTRSKLFVVTCLFVYIFLQSYIHYIPVVPGLFEWLIPFWIGRYYFSEKNRWKTRMKNHSRCYFLITLAAYIIIFVGAYWLRSLQAGFVPSYLLGASDRLLSGIMGLLGSVLFAKLCHYVYMKIDSVRRFMLWIDNYGFDIYLLHQPFIVSASVILLSKLGLGVFGIPCGVLLGVIIPVLISKYIIRRNKLLKLLLLGIR